MFGNNKPKITKELIADLTNRLITDLNIKRLPDKKIYFYTHNNYYESNYNFFINELFLKLQEYSKNNSIPVHVPVNKAFAESLYENINKAIKKTVDNITENIIPFNDCLYNVDRKETIPFSPEYINIYKVNANFVNAKSQENDFVKSLFTSREEYERFCLFLTDILTPSQKQNKVFVFKNHDFLTNSCVFEIVKSIVGEKNIDYYTLGTDKDYENSEFEYKLLNVQNNPKSECFNNLYVSQCIKRKPVVLYLLNYQSSINLLNIKDKQRTNYVILNINNKVNFDKANIAYFNTNKRNIINNLIVDIIERIPDLNVDVFNSMDFNDMFTTNLSLEEQQEPQTVFNFSSIAEDTIKENALNKMEENKNIETPVKNFVHGVDNSQDTKVNLDAYNMYEENNTGINTVPNSTMPMGYPTMPFMGYPQMPYPMPPSVTPYPTYQMPYPIPQMQGYGYYPQYPQPMVQMDTPVMETDMPVQEIKEETVTAKEDKNTVKKKKKRISRVSMPEDLPPMSVEDLAGFNFDNMLDITENEVIESKDDYLSEESFNYENMETPYINEEYITEAVENYEYQNFDAPEEYIAEEIPMVLPPMENFELETELTNFEMAETMVEPIQLEEMFIAEKLATEETETEPEEVVETEEVEEEVVETTECECNCHEEQECIEENCDCECHEEEQCECVCHEDQEEICVNEDCNCECHEEAVIIEEIPETYEDITLEEETISTPEYSYEPKSFDYNSIPAMEENETTAQEFNIAIIPPVISIEQQESEIATMEEQQPVIEEKPKTKKELKLEQKAKKKAEKEQAMLDKKQGKKKKGLFGWLFEDDKKATEEISELLNETIEETATVEETVLNESIEPIDPQLEEFKKFQEQFNTVNMNAVEEEEEEEEEVVEEVEEEEEEVVEEVVEEVEEEVEVAVEVETETEVETEITKIEVEATEDIVVEELINEEEQLEFIPIVPQMPDFNEKEEDNDEDILDLQKELNSLEEEFDMFETEEIEYCSQEELISEDDMVENKTEVFEPIFDIYNYGKADGFKSELPEVEGIYSLPEEVIEEIETPPIEEKVEAVIHEDIYNYNQEDGFKSDLPEVEGIYELEENPLVIEEETEKVEEIKTDVLDIEETELKNKFKTQLPEDVRVDLETLYYGDTIKVPLLKNEREWQAKLARERLVAEQKQKDAELKKLLDVENERKRAEEEELNRNFLDMFEKETFWERRKREKANKNKNNNTANIDTLTQNAQNDTEEIDRFIKEVEEIEKLNEFLNS